MKKIVITQRFEKIGRFNEVRDNIDSKLPSLIQKLGFTPVLVPNNLNNLNKFIKQISPKGVILSGGGDPLKKDSRYITENKLIKISINKNIPIIGICRGAQALNIFFGGKLKRVANHVRKHHRIYGPLVKNMNIKVNSYHDLGFFENTLGKNLELLAYSSDKVIKSFSHNKLKVLGIMWHPERYKKIKNFDKNLIKNFFHKY